MKKLLKRLPINGAFALLLLLVIACNNDHRILYHTYQTNADDNWKKKDTLKFNVPPTDSLKTVMLYAEVRNTLSYPYSDLYLVVRQNLADSLQWHTDTIRFVLADSQGRWTGYGSGNYYQSARPVCRIRMAPHPFHATIRVSQGMKDEVLKGISNVGLRIEY
jgi:gliding motility-associated lipoprotein GldH